MIYFLVLLPATALTIAGYFTLFLSTRFEGGMRAFGKYLGFWAITLAALLVLGAIFAAARGGHHCTMWMHGMHRQMNDVPRDPGPPSSPSEPPAAPPVAPHG